MGLPSMLVVISDNHLESSQMIGEIGAAAYLGESKTLDELGTAQVIYDLMGDVHTRQRMASIGRAIIDGRGTERVIECLLSQTDVPRLRPAETEDSFFFWQWANDPHVRANSFRSDPIPWETHQNWFARKLASEQTRIWVLEHRGIAIAHIRYEITADLEAEISYTVAPGYRGRGWGTRILELSVTRACQELGIHRVTGITFTANTASIRAFEKAGFSHKSEFEMSNRMCFLFERVCTSDRAIYN